MARFARMRPAQRPAASVEGVRRWPSGAKRPASAPAETGPKAPAFRGTSRYGTALRASPSHRGVLVAALLAVLLAAAGIWTPIPAQFPDQVPVQPPEHSPEGPPADSRGRDLAEIRREIGRLEERLESARERERTLEERLEAAALELELQRRRVAEAVAARELAEERVTEAEAEVARLEGALREARASLRKRVTGLYRLGRHGHLRLLLSVEAGADLPSAVRLLRFLVRRDARAIDDYREAAERLAAERQRLVAERLEVERWFDQAESRRRRLAQVRAQRERLLARARDERRQLAERAESLVQKERKLANLIDFLSGRQTAPLSGRPIGEFRGVLDWPVDGEVVLGFGPRKDPRYRTEVPHNGIEIRPEPASGTETASATAEIQAVYPGKVLFAAPFEGYGLTVIVHHPGRVFSLYAGLDELLVAQGDVLRLGDPVGMTSDRVYFEVRRENRPEDPLAWLR